MDVSGSLNVFRRFREGWNIWPLNRSASSRDGKGAVLFASTDEVLTLVYRPNLSVRVSFLYSFVWSYGDCTVVVVSIDLPCEYSILKMFFHALVQKLIAFHPASKLKDEFWFPFLRIYYMYLEHYYFPSIFVVIFDLVWVKHRTQVKSCFREHGKRCNVY